MGRHQEQWWAQFLEASDHFDAAYLVEGIGDLLTPHIGYPLLRREVELAVASVVRHLERPGITERAELAEKATERLARTLERMNDSATGAEISTAEAATVALALRGEYAAAAAGAEPVVGTAKLQKLFVTALRLERFDVPMALRLLEGGQQPAEAVRSGHLLGKYGWWPSWLLRVVTERALAGHLDQETVVALDRCAYAELTPLQANLARKLLSGNQDIIDTAAQRMVSLGEADAAAALREGDINAVALTARLISS
ncbi:hypothetical protein ACIBSW_09205 [Actinoplanes sp. NPDC049668]|uniref:hypothetical protein n=1 Tax=unclassified Actinoplanes TaxID=2626549 RepID=UPI0033A43DBB